jgi:hypothetical protein
VKESDSETAEEYASLGSCCELCGRPAPTKVGSGPGQADANDLGRGPFDVRHRFCGLTCLSRWTWETLIRSRNEVRPDAERGQAVARVTTRDPTTEPISVASTPPC